MYACKHILFQVHTCVIYIHTCTSVSFISFHLFCLFYFCFNFSHNKSNTDYSYGSVTEVGPSCCLVLLSTDGKAGWQDGGTFVTWPIWNISIFGYLFPQNEHSLMHVWSFTWTGMYVYIILSLIILLSNINHFVFVIQHQLFICIIWKLCWFIFTKQAYFISMYNNIYCNFPSFKNCVL